MCSTPNIEAIAVVEIISTFHNPVGDTGTNMMPISTHMSESTLSCAKRDSISDFKTRTVCNVFGIGTKATSSLSEVEKNVRLG